MQYNMSKNGSLDWLSDSDTMEDDKSPLLPSAQIQVSGQMIKKADELRGDSSPFGAVFIVVNAALGAGLLTFPYVFFLAGGHTEWYWGVVTELALVPFILISLITLAHCTELTQSSTYEMMMGKMWGAWARITAEICIAIYCFGCCVTYLVVIGEQMEDISAAFSINNHSLSDEWWFSKEFVIPIVTIIFIFPWLLFQSIGVLGYTSFLSVLACFTISIMVTVKHYTLPLDNSTCPFHRSIPESCNDWSWTSSLNAIPFICFAYQCHVSSIPIYAGLKPKWRGVSYFSVIVVIGIAICFYVYTSTGVFGFLTFLPDECVNSDILRNYCPNDIAISIARGLLILCLITSYPILHFCGRLALDSVLTNLSSAVYRKIYKKEIVVKFRCGSKKWFPGPERWRAWTESVVWMVLSVILALFVPQVKYVISPMGCLAAVFMLVFPGFCLLKLTFLKPRPVFARVAMVCLACVMVIIGVFVFGNSLIYNILKDFGIITD